MAEKKSVLNVTVSESIALAVRRAATDRDTTISSVVEEALADHLKWFRLREAGLAAIDEYYREHGYPTPEESAAARAQVIEEERLHDEALAADDRDRGSAA